MDRALAPFIDELPTPVVVAFTSDHGEALGEHGAWGHGLNLYQEAVQVPLMIRGPGVPAREVREPAQLLSLAPTRHATRLRVSRTPGWCVRADPGLSSRVGGQRSPKACHRFTAACQHMILKQRPISVNRVAEHVSRNGSAA